MNYKTRKRMKKMMKVLIVIAVVIMGLHFGGDALSNALDKVQAPIANRKGNDSNLDNEIETLLEILNEYGEEELETVSAPVMQGKVPDRLEIPAAIEGHQVVDHGYYALSYNEEWEIPDWVAYTIDLDELNTNVTGRTENFREDPAIVTGSAELSDYKRSGYSRGHMCPSASRTSSVEANSSTFLMSNMVPQIQRFNAGLWLKAEDAVRDAGRMYGEVYVVTGPVITDNMKTIGANKVGVPEECYKALLVIDDDGEVQTIAMAMPQEYEDGNLKPYFMTVDALEKKTGLDFFPQLDDATERATESTYDLSVWPKSFR